MSNRSVNNIMWSTAVDFIRWHTEYFEIHDRFCCEKLHAQHPVFPVKYVIGHIIKQTSM